MNYSVLIVDDETELAESTAEYFNMFDVPSKCVFTAEDALGFFKDNTAKLILLDINLSEEGGMSGFDLCKKIRETLDVPILFISARSSDDDMVIALNIGGDDYITKPFDLGEVLVRIEALLRRSGSRAADAEKLTTKDLVLSKSDGRVYIAGEEIVLTSREYAILELLLSHPDKIFSKSNIFDAIWDDDSEVYDDNAVKVHMSNLRRKLAGPSGEEYIETVWGMGYRLAK